MCTGLLSRDTGATAGHDQRRGRLRVDRHQRNYVVAGDSTQGLLLDRLKGIPRPMPPDGPFRELQPGNYDLIALWIAEGAFNN